VFAARGTSASTEEIARRAGLGIGTVFRHFPTKEALVEAILLDRLTNLAEEAESLSTDADPGAALLALFRRMVDRSAAKRAYADALADAGLDPEVTMSQVGQRLRSAMDALLTRAQRSGAIRDDLGVTDLIALVVGASRAAEHAGWDRAVQDRTLAVIFSGLRPPPADTPA